METLKEKQENYPNAMMIFGETALLLRGLFGPDVLEAEATFIRKKAAWLVNRKLAKLASREGGWISGVSLKEIEAQRRMLAARIRILRDYHMEGVDRYSCNMTHGPGWKKANPTRSADGDYFDDADDSLLDAASRGVHGA